MKLQKRIPLSNLYDDEDQFSENLADHLEALGLGRFEDPVTQAKVETTKICGMKSKKLWSQKASNFTTLA